MKVEFAVILGTLKANSLFLSDKKLSDISMAGSQVIKEFKVAYKEYSIGRWDICQAMLQNLLAKFPNDGPSISLLNVLKSYNYTAPYDWKGFRALTEK